MNNAAGDAAYRAETVVIGSGPGGAVTAAKLAESGRRVLLIEEGTHFEQTSATPFSYREMAQKYRGGGITVAFGQPDIAYAEGRCAGGGSEVNSGLYHRLPDEVCADWQRLYHLDDFGADTLAQHFTACEHSMQPQAYPGQLPAASQILRDGATALNWSSQDVPRLVEFTSATDAEGIAVSRRMSMTRTYLPRFVAAGGQMLTETRVQTLRQQADESWTVTATGGNGAPVHVHADDVCVAAGAIHTPALLRRSGITRNIGNTLALQPMLKVTGEFDRDVNFAGMGIAGEQVKEFAPAYSFGCSISSPAHLAINLLWYPGGVEHAIDNHTQLISWYVMSVGLAAGTVRNLPYFDDPLVRYKISRGERQNLAEGARNLSRLLLAAGAHKVYTGVREHPLVEREDDLRGLPDELGPASADLMTVHMMGSCPMGEERSRAAVDSFGRVHDISNLRIADASILCDSPAVNPQGTIMALAHRNTEHFLND